MKATLWSDYLCPWCYVGTDRTRLLRELGVEVTVRPYELHPEIPDGGFRLAERSGPARARAVALYDRLATEAEAVGLPFRRPSRLPNTRRALATAEAVRTRWPSSFAELDRLLFDAHFNRGWFLSDPDVVDQLVTEAGAPPDEVRIAIDDFGYEAVSRSMGEAADVGVTGTPSWWVDDRLLVPGLQTRDWYERVITKMKATAGGAPARGG